MPSEFDKYRVKRGDNLGEETFWNERFRPIDARLTSLEMRLADVDTIAAAMEKVALDRINNSVTPLVEDARARLASIPNLFSATSLSDVEVGEGEKAFVIEQAARQTWAVAKTVFVQRLGDNTVWMAGDFVSFDRETGDLVIDVSDFQGAGTFRATKAMRATRARLALSGYGAALGMLARPMRSVMSRRTMGRRGYRCRRTTPIMPHPSCLPRPMRGGNWSRPKARTAQLARMPLILFTIPLHPGW